MKRATDMTGQVFGKLTVTGRDGTRGGAYWHCACACGASCVIAAGNLRSGASKSCGCGKRGPREDMTGKVFGRLTVLRLAGMDHDGASRWETRCECGTETIVVGGALRGDGTKSCGCWLREQRAARASERASARVLAGEKRCPHCKITKPMDRFYAAAKQRDGRSIWCRDCTDDRRYVGLYGITLGDKRGMIEAQGGLCAVRGCERAVDTGSALDHCHDSGQIRSVLCNGCNSALGHLGESARRIEGLAEYARQWKQLRLVPGGKAS